MAVSATQAAGSSPSVDDGSRHGIGMRRRIAVVGVFALVLAFGLRFAEPQDAASSRTAVDPIAGGAVQPQMDRGGAAKEVEQPAVDRAVDRGLAWLAGRQQTTTMRYVEDDGSEVELEVGYWRNDAGYKINYQYEVLVENAAHPGVTAIACLAFMAGGHTPGRGAYGDVVRRGMNFLIASMIRGDDGPAGYLTYDETRMYSHAFGTLLLAELLGMANLSPAEESRLRRTLSNAVDLISESQTLIEDERYPADDPRRVYGGWRYAPNATDTDMSQVVCQLQALRAAANVGIHVPVDVISRAKDYVARSYVREGDARRGRMWDGSDEWVEGQFRYQIGGESGPDTRTSWTLTAAGMVALQSAGSYDRFSHPDGSVYGFGPTIGLLRRGHEQHRDRQGRPVDPDQLSTRTFLPFGWFYGHYYAAQAFYQYGRDVPSIWREYHDDIRARLINMQYREGYWADAIGPHYATAMACLILQLHLELLPIFQK